LFEIFSLKTGVIIHVHDVFYPFEYPKAWVIDGNGRFGWNEAYILRAFLMYQDKFEILFHNDFPNFSLIGSLKICLPMLRVAVGRVYG
jgi:hypothetical protein